jgi:hypothetical protein
MAHEEIPIEASVTTADAPGGASESADRRSFLKGAFTVSAAAAAGGLAGSASAAEPAQGKQQPAGGGNFAGIVHVQFSSRNKPNLEDLQSALRQIVGKAGCPTCGLGGIDLRLTAPESVEIESRIPLTVVVDRAAAGS